jgi:ABC-type antimicrobial peptide transport system permease subunit
MDAVPRWLTVVGVARNIRGFSLNRFDESQMYVSSLQFPSSYMFLIVRTATPPLGLAAAVQDQIRTVDPDQAVGDVRTMDDAVSASVPRFNVELLGIFALIAVFLAAVGVYGVSSYTVGQRRREIGVRMALGAESRDVLVMIVRGTLRVGVIAVVAGLLGSAAVVRMLTGMLYGVAPTDPLAYAGAAGFLLAVVLFAAYVPARRASHVDPTTALRAE